MNPEDLSALRSTRGPCPPAETLVEYQALDEGDRAHHPAHDHIVICSRCQLVLLHTSEPTARNAPLVRWALPVAALLVLGAGISLVWRAGALAPTTTGIETIRGNDIQPVAPIGKIDAITEFSWQSPAGFARYRVRVYRGGTVVWQAETADTRIAPPRDAIPATVELRWIVEGIDRGGDARMASPPQTFTWIPRIY